jgi:hypothetical protein
MFLVGLLQWWYCRGWRGKLREAGRRLGATIDFFSIGHLLATLFDPYRQISAGRLQGTVGDQLRGFLDKTISRVIGAIVRLFTILAGVICLAFQVLFEGLIIGFWWFLPLFPIFGFLMFAVGWVPSWR